MHKNSTRQQSSQSFIKNTTETQSFKNKVSFLQNYCRAFTILKTNSIVHIEFALN